MASLKGTWEFNTLYADVLVDLLNKGKIEELTILKTVTDNGNPYVLVIYKNK